MFFTLCKKFNIKLHPGNCVLFSLVVRWCGRLFSAAGSKFDPRRIEGLLKMPPPSTGADLQQFLCPKLDAHSYTCVFYAGISITYASRTFLHPCGRQAPKAAVARITLSEVGWTGAHAEAFQKCQSSLANASSCLTQKTHLLIHRCFSGLLVLYHYPGPPEDLDLPPEQQRHEPLAFLSGSFTGSMRRCFIFEKEAYAIIASCDRIDWLLQRTDGFSLFTDCHNLLYCSTHMAIPVHRRRTQRAGSSSGRSSCPLTAIP
jgi:RNase H-like domain found in reverse transcriptase